MMLANVVFFGVGLMGDSSSSDTSSKSITAMSVGSQPSIAPVKLSLRESATKMLDKERVNRRVEDIMNDSGLERTSTSYTERSMLHKI
jgi:hypothetical protein